MWIIESLLAKYERRLTKIRANPDPNRLASNELLAELWRDHYQGVLGDCRAGKPTCLMQLDCPRLFHAMGLTTIQANRTGDQLPRDLIERALDRAGQAGFPEEGCDRIRIAAGVVLSGGLPKIDFVAGGSTCYQSMYRSVWSAHYLNVPSYMVYLPRHNDYAGVRYVAAQLQELIRLAESTVPGVKYDQTRLETLQERDRRIDESVDSCMELKMAEPCAMSGADGFRLPPLSIDDPRLIDHAELLLKELRRKAERQASKKEIARVYWTVSAPMFTDVFRCLEEQGVSIPLFEEGWGVPFGRRLGDTRQYAKKLSVIEEEAAALLHSAWNGPPQWRVEEIARRSQEAKIDGIVHWEEAGCNKHRGSSRLVAEAVGTMLDIPSLFVDGRSQEASKVSIGDVQRSLEQFADVLASRKGKRAVGSFKANHDSFVCE